MCPPTPLPHLSRPSPHAFRLRARVVLPMAGSAIENGAVTVADGRIIHVGRWKDSRDAVGPVFDLGEVILLPGLINAHCHLDYTHMGGRLPPMKRFTNWIQAIVSLKSDWSYTEFAASWMAGTRLLLESGTTTVADVEAVPELLPDLWSATPLRVMSFRELIQLKPEPAPARVVEAAVEDWNRHPACTGRVGLSPHATYTTTPELLGAAATSARQQGWRLMTHVAESAEEFEMFQNAEGLMFDWLKSQRDMSDCGKGSPVQALERAGYLGPNLLAIHLNYLGPDDAGILARHQVHGVHCPGSHAYFNHQPFPYQQLTAAGVNLCLGTDSMASMPKRGGIPGSLDLFSEMRTMSMSHPQLSPGDLLRMATLNGARALDKEGVLGVLAVGALADAIAVPFSGSMATVEAAVVEHVGPVQASMIEGRWVLGDVT